MASWLSLKGKYYSLSYICGFRFNFTLDRDRYQIMDSFAKINDKDLHVLRTHGHPERGVVRRRLSRKINKLKREIFNCSTEYDSYNSDIDSKYSNDNNNNNNNNSDIGDDDKNNYISTNYHNNNSYIGDDDKNNYISTNYDNNNSNTGDDDKNNYISTNYDNNNSNTGDDDKKDCIRTNYGYRNDNVTTAGATTYNNNINNDKYIKYIPNDENDSKNNDINDNDNDNSNKNKKKGYVGKSTPVFIYIIVNGIENYYKVGFNSQSVRQYARRFHSYIGEFNYLRFDITMDDREAAKAAGRQIEAKFKTESQPYQPFAKYELLMRYDDDGKDMLPIYKKLIVTIINRELSKTVSIHHFTFVMSNYPLHSLELYASFI